LGSNRELWWDGVRFLMDKSRDFNVLAVCYSAKGLINKVGELKPDVVLYDKDLDGEDERVTRVINRLHPDVRIIIIIRLYQDITFGPNSRSVAQAYIDKNITYKELANCIHYVAERKRGFFYSVVGQRLFETSDVNTFNNGSIELSNLSKREKEILYLLARKGLSNKQIADTANITENTVKAHLKNIFGKIHVTNRQQAVIAARMHSLVGRQDINSETAR
jgi:DNA-binding NarL/FixJ family response regulator